MKRTPIGFDAAAAISDALGLPDRSSWQFAGTPADDTDAAPAVWAVESGIDVHAAGIDLQVNVPASDILFAAATPTSSTDADIVSIWPSPPSQPADTQIVGFGVTVAASQAQEENADQTDTLASQHGSAGLQSASFAPVVFVPAMSANLAPALSASHAVDSFDFGLGAVVGAMPQHMELPDVGAHTLTAAVASPAVTALPADFAMLANPSSALDEPVTNSQVGSGGATAAQVQHALDESGLSVNGSGIKVGVLSDSFNDLGGAAADETDGALPPASDIQVLKDLSSGGTDEGRAMMQIIHDIAPGADLAFYTAFDSEQDFANGILALAAAGCKVIVDDVSYFDEPFFQNGIVAQAIQTVEAEGVTYVTAAGNEASNAYQTAWTPIAHTSYGGYSLSDIESFGGSPVQTVTVGGNVPLILEWNQSYGGATSDLEILAFHNGNLAGVSESEASSNNPWAGIELSAGTYQIAIENLSGPNPGLIKEITFGDGIPVTISGANVGTVYGHAMTPGAITAGAVSAADTPAFGDNAPTSESFSSSGAGTELLFANDGTALPSPDVLSPVAVSGIDDIKTTVPGGLSDFYGTSASSASLAGVAALMLAANPNLTPTQVEQIMEETALLMSNSAVSGAGLVQVDAAIAAAMPGPEVTVANVTLSQTSVAASSLFTASDSDGDAITEYGFWDSGAGGGHFVLNGATQPTNEEIDVSASQLSELTYHSGSGADTLSVRAFDAAGWGPWSNSFTVTAPVDTGPTVAVANLAATHGESFDASSLFSSYGDPLSQAATEYDFWNTGAGGGHFVLNGTILGANQDNIITAVQLAQLSYQSGSGADMLWVRANDGNVWGAWSNAFTVTAPVDSGPTDVVANVMLSKGVTSVAASGLFTYSDPFGSAATEYDVWDTGTSGGHFVLNGTTPLSTNTDNYITAAQLSSLTYQAGTGADALWVRANDGTVWGAWSIAFTVSPWVETPPVVAVSNVVATHGESFAASSLFTAGDPNGDTITEYAVWDTGAGGGHFVLNGVTQARNLEIDVSAAQVSQLSYQSGVGADTLWVRASDGTMWSAWSNAFTVTGPVDTGPTVQVSNLTASHGESFAGSSLFSDYSDPFNQSAIEYDFWDTGAGGHHFVLDGTILGSNQDNIITASQLAQLTYQSGSGADTLWVRANDGTVWGAWSNAFTVTAPVDSGPTETVSNVMLSKGVSSVAASSLFTYSDPFDSAATEYGFWDTGAGGGHFVLDGVAQPTDQEIFVPAVQLSQLSYQAGSGADALWVQANDGTVWGAWSNAFTVGPWVQTAPVVTVPANTTTVAGQVFSSDVTASDPDGDSITEYAFWDSNGNGAFYISGVKQATHTEIDVPASEFGQVTYVSGIGTDQLWARAADGTLWSSWESFNVTGVTSAVVDAGATLVFSSNYSGQVTFAASTGMLKLDQPSTFSGQIFGFIGNGTLAGSDQIDLKGINYNTVQDSYASGVLTVVDGTNTVRLSFSGSYSLGNFKFASDGDGGTIVYDPPVSNTSAPIRNTVTTDHSTDVFVFGPQLEQAVSTDHRYESEAVHFDHAQVAFGLVAPVHHGPETMIIADAAHDAITFRDALAQSHQAHFLI